MKALRYLFITFPFALVFSVGYTQTSTTFYNGISVKLDCSAPIRRALSAALEYRVNRNVSLEMQVEGRQFSNTGKPVEGQIINHYVLYNKIIRTINPNQSFETGWHIIGVRLPALSMDKAPEKTLTTNLGIRLRYGGNRDRRWGQIWGQFNFGLNRYEWYEFSQNSKLVGSSEKTHLLSYNGYTPDNQLSVTYQTDQYKNFWETHTTLHRKILFPSGSYDLGWTRRLNRRFDVELRLSGVWTPDTPYKNDNISVLRNTRLLGRLHLAYWLGKKRYETKV